MVTFLKNLSAHSLKICKQLTVKGSYELLQSDNFFPIELEIRVSNGNQISDHFGNNYLLDSFSDLMSVCNLRIDSNVQRNFKNSHHNQLIKRVLAFVLKDSSGLERFTNRANPGSVTWAREVTLNQYFYVNHSL